MKKAFIVGLIAAAIAATNAQAWTFWDTYDAMDRHNYQRSIRVRKCQTLDFSAFLMTWIFVF